MIEMPFNEGQEKVAAFQMDLQRFADDAVDAGSSVDNGGGVADTGAGTSDADESDSNIVVGDTGDGEADSGSVDQNDDEEVPGAVKGQSPEANKAFAEMRKQKQAAEMAAQKAKEEIQKQRDAEFASRFGDSHGIFTEQQYWAALDREQKQRQAEVFKQQAELPKQLYTDLIAQGYDPKVAESIAEGLATKLELQQIKQEREAEKKINKEMQTKAQQEAAKEKVAKQIMADHEALSKKYGELVPTLDAMDEATVELMKQGIPLKAAWLTAHEDEVIEFAKNNGAKKMAKNVSSKAHLQSEKSGAGSFGKEVDLSPEQLRVWKAMGYNDKEARKRAAKYMKQGK
jgi:hypothetical protein